MQVMTREMWRLAVIILSTPISVSELWGEQRFVSRDGIRENVGSVGPVYKVQTYPERGKEPFILPSLVPLF